MKISASRHFSKPLIACVLIGLLLTQIVVRAVTITPYLWFFPYVDPTTTNATALVARLQTEVQKILNAGNGLSIVEFEHTDQGQASGEGNQYWLYVKPGRLITTLAWAYPYMTAAQKTAARTWVQTELASSTFQPWAAQLTPATGTKRELYPMVTRPVVSYASYPTYTPALEQLYGLWLWGWQIGGNWADITTHQAAIRTWYTSIASQGGIYGQMGGHIAKARLERIWGNGANETTATNNLQTAMDNGTTFATVDNLVSNAATGLWRFEYLDSRKQNGQYLGWMFLGASPEVARYIGTSGENIAAALTRHASGKSSYPLWWMRQAGYDNGMAGVGNNLEGSGMTAETIGMIAPLERYAVGASSATLQSYTKSGPLCIGDSYFMELLVYAIESTGTSTQVDVRNGHP